MGRYYYTNTGREGKFMFGVQPSTDPETMGMSEDQSCIQYYASGEDEPRVKEALDRQYDILEIPDKDRIYYVKGWGDYDKFEHEVLDDKVWVKCKMGSEEDKKRRANKESTWAGNKDDEVMYEKRDGMTLALSRIRLGLVILSDIKDEGYCSLEAET